MVVCVEGSMGAWYRLWWVWLERCRDGSYAVNALRCDVWVVCTCIVLVSLVFGEVFFGGSASLHGLFLHFLAKCFFCNLFWGIFWRW